MGSLKQYLVIAFCSCVFYTYSNIAWASPRCYLYGKIRPVNSSNQTGVQSIKDFIRMNFDANSDSKCERMLSSYCRNNILNRDYVPVSLRAYFRTNNSDGRTYDFDIDQSCGITKTGGF